jgi:hypothetical protein
MMTLDTLCGAVPPEMMLMITKKDTAKKAWEMMPMITTMRVSDNCVKKVIMQQLRR